MSRILTIPIRPYSAGISLQIPEDRMSEADWQVLMAVLDAMKPALVTPDDTEPARNAYSTDDLNDAASNLRHLAAIDPEASVARVAFLRDLADRFDAHERDT